jgi:hypothetical protein
MLFRDFVNSQSEPAILPTLKFATQRNYRRLARRHLRPIVSSVAGLITGEVSRPAGDSHSPPIRRAKSAYAEANSVAKSHAPDFGISTSETAIPPEEKSLNPGHLPEGIRLQIVFSSSGRATAKNKWRHQKISFSPN